MSYPIRYTDTDTNPSPITVQDQSLNTDTSLTFVGKNFTGFSQYVGENFLHLLENFAKASAPSNPVKGQLWYKTGTDSSPARPQLMVYDGTRWTEAGNVKKGTAQPSAENSVIGDLWVDLTNQQLYLFSGATWVLVGPQFSEGSLSGLKAESIIDRDTNTPKTVLIFYTSDVPVIIVSKDTFTPKVTIAGFEIIKAGVNLSNLDFASNGTGYGKYWGTAEKASSLLVGNNTVLASNFLRSDTVNTTNYVINIRNGGGLVIGDSLETSFTSSGTLGVVIATKTQGAPITLKTTATGGTQNNVVTVTANQRVGINNVSPGQGQQGSWTGLDVNGSILSNNKIITTDTTVSTNTTSGALQVAGGVGIAGALNVGGNVKAGGHVTVGSSVAGIAINANLNEQHDIGSSTGNRFRTVYSKDFVGDTFTGSFVGGLTGNITGAAAKLAQVAQFSMRGDVTSNVIPFNGSEPVPAVSISSVARSSSTATITTTTNHNFVSGYIVNVTCSNSSFNTTSAGAVITVTGLNTFTYANTGTTLSTTLATGTITVSPGGSYVTALSERVIANKTEITDSISTDYFLVYRATATPALRKISKATLFSTAGTVPTGSIFPFAGETLPSGYLLCDGSEQSQGVYPELFNVVGYKYKALGLLRGYNTFALPDLRGRFPLGRENMDNGNTVSIQISATSVLMAAIPALGSIAASFVVQDSLTTNGPFQAGKVVEISGLVPAIDVSSGPVVITGVHANTPIAGYTTLDVSMQPQTQTWSATSNLVLSSLGSIDAGGGTPVPSRVSSATSVGVSGGSSSYTLDVTQLPQHRHNLKGNTNVNQYYAIRDASGIPNEDNVIQGNLHFTSGRGHFLTDSGDILTAQSVGQSIDNMTPFQTINYIIFTGRIL
jgi:microcystin-dependent protein